MPNSISSEQRRSIEHEARRIEEDSMHSAKSQFVEARAWTRVNYWIGIPTAALAAVGGAYAFADKGVTAGILATFVAALTAVMTFLNPSSKATRHHDAGTQYQALLNNTRIFRTVELGGQLDGAALIQKLMDLGNARDKLNRESPQVRQRSFETGRRSIEKGEADYSVDSKAANP